MRNLGIGSILLIILIFIPVLGADRYLLGQIILFLIYAAVATHWNLLFGYAGIFSLAQLTMFGIGAYAMAMLSFYFGLSIWLAIPLAGIIALLAALILGLATLRLAGVYTALLTLARCTGDHCPHRYRYRMFYPDRNILSPADRWSRRLLRI